MKATTAALTTHIRKYNACTVLVCISAWLSGNAVVVSGSVRP